MDDWIEVYVVTGRIILNFFPVFLVLVACMIYEWRLERKGGVNVEKRRKSQSSSRGSCKDYEGLSPFKIL